MRRPWHVSRAPIAACESTCVNGVEWWRYTSITLLDQVLRYNELWLCFNDIMRSRYYMESMNFPKLALRRMALAEEIQRTNNRFLLFVVRT